ncbi:MAG: type I secretion C-terminal target domain-containing protein [Paracoccus sp. (in: a-proteobacteria)]|uniref:calcium-binding protein n=1 Tax=Paracoccus sp. TaxID=267 RepID=UPI0026E07019|nr:type I secretion C-terminal target domain-containing protein [Paracoccus sp. (in: a-proteobacteria)]MDO5622335.1 type I secretion C-terminal target domain-containing protein [Paracoccus sp. (in: a-proteobacteria)]
MAKADINTPGALFLREGDEWVVRTSVQMTTSPDDQIPRTLEPLSVSYNLEYGTSGQKEIGMGWQTSTKIEQWQYVIFTLTYADEITLYAVDDGILEDTEIAWFTVSLRKDHTFNDGNVDKRIEVHILDSSNNKTIGTEGNDTLNGTAGDDVLRGGAGDDRYYVSLGDRIIENANEGIDTAFSNYDWTLERNVENLVLVGSDDLKGTGNALNNEITGNAGNNLLNGFTGADTMAGGAGNDTYVVDNTGDRVIELAGEGIDTVRDSIDYRLTQNVENLILTGTATVGTGNSYDNRLNGNAADNILSGLVGNDTIHGGAGNDSLTGGAGADRLTGGAGADVFIFEKLSDSGVTATTRDTIRDFNRAEGDKIDLSQLDADSLTDGVQAFSFIGSDDFSGTAGELRFTQGRTITVVEADVDGDGVVDFSVQVNGSLTLIETDFLL